MTGDFAYKFFAPVISKHRSFNCAGDTALTLILLSARSAAKFLAILLIAALVEEYTLFPDTARCAAVEETRIIDAVLFKYFIAFWIVKKVPL